MQKKKVWRLVAFNGINHRRVCRVKHFIPQRLAPALKLISLRAFGANKIINRCVIRSVVEALFFARGAKKISSAPVFGKDTRNLRRTFVAFSFFKVEGQFHNTKLIDKLWTMSIV